MRNLTLNRKIKNLSTLQVFLFLLTFITYSAGYTQDEKKEISHSVYITANTGMDNSSVSRDILDQINKSSQTDKDATFLLAGNLTRTKGYPKGKDQRKEEEKYLSENLLAPLRGFNGKIIFTPGVNEWNKKGHKSIDDLESFLQDNSKAKFWPNDGCALEKEDLNDDVVLVMVDSQWFLEDWDDYPYINNKCDLKTREQFFVEFRDDLKDSQGKTVIVAIHHPVLSNTKHGVINEIGGFSKQSFQSTTQIELRSRLETIAKQFDDVIFVSGNDRNLQYVDHHGVPQIISGAATKTQKAKPEKKEHLASSKNGYAKLTVFKDGSSVVDFYEVKDKSSKLLFSKEIKRQRTTLDEVSWEPRENYGPTYKASVYTEEETDKSGLYKWVWGEHYRDIYSKKIEAPILIINELEGNVKPISEGGGNQSRSLRLINDNDNEYTLRALKKSAARFIQKNIKTHYVKEYIENTVAERIVLDYYTTAHPYAPFALNEMMDELDIYHANPKIYYLPKQEGLGIFNDEYGDALFMWEEHVGDENKEFETFGSPDDILSTADLIEELNENKKAIVDENSYIKARLFDMLIGDWDRHSDQWRWAEFKQGDDTKLYKPIPRDRDQAFSKYDGPIIDLLKLGFPPFRAMQSFHKPLKNTKWFNVAAYSLDKKFIHKATWEDWKAQVTFIQKNLTDAKIDAAFNSLPKDVQDESIAEIQKQLKLRRDNLLQIAQDYYKYFQKFEIITGTEKDDEFLITRKKNGATSIDISRKGKIVFQNDYNSKDTKEIWIYGLDGDDKFKIVGKGNDLIKLKILGGEEHDIYDFENPRKAKLYDYESKKNTIVNSNSRKWLIDSYDINNYDYTKRKTSQNSAFPTIGFSSDAGFKLGFSDTYTTYGLVRNPFTTKHTVGVDYYFDTEGWELSYNGEFAHFFYKWNLGIDALYTSPNFTMNYFGTGNTTLYDEDAVDLDYNRVNIEQWHFAPSLIYANDRGSRFQAKALIESFEVKNNTERFVSAEYEDENDVFEDQIYAGAEIGYTYLNKKNNPAFPNRGMQFDLISGYKASIDDHDNKFGYINPSLSLDIPLHSSGIAVLATKIGGEMILGDNYEFYHGATIGGNESLRAYRNERFNGKSSFYQTTDLRLGLARMRTNFVPLRFGLTGGFDYGRVWTDNDNSDEWHTDYGGSIFINGFSAFTANIGYYTGDDGSRIVFTMGFKF